MLEFLSLGVLSGTVTLGLFFVEPSQAPTGSDGVSRTPRSAATRGCGLFAVLLLGLVQQQC